MAGFISGHKSAAAMLTTLAVMAGCAYERSAHPASRLEGDSVIAVPPVIIARVTVVIDSSQLTIPHTARATAIAEDARGARFTGTTPRWESSNSLVAEVTPDGVVRAVGEGTAAITASIDTRSGHQDILVVAPSPAPATPPPPPVSSGAATIIFQDGFETGDLNAQQNGVSWIGNAYVDVSSAIARSGSRAARFNQGASKEWSELRFGGLPNLSEAFVQFYIYMPSGNESPSVGPRVRVLGSKNDKFFRIWGGDYAANPGNKVGASLWGNGTDGDIGIEYMYNPGSGAQWEMGPGPDGIMAPFVKDANRGRWIQVRIRSKPASSANNDGVFQLWVDGTLLVSSTTLKNDPGSGPKTYTEGYLLGWANNGYAAGQVLYVDDFTISTGGFPTP